MKQPLSFLCLVLCLLIVFIFVYGSYHLLTRSERIALAESQRTEIVRLETKLMYAENASKYVLIMEQIFTPQMLDELKVLNFKIKKEKEKGK